MAVITMTREMGTLGKDVAQGIADQLGVTVVHHELVEHHLSERLGVQESAVHRYLEGSASLLERWKIDGKKLSHFTAEEILELAQKGNVLIRGWGGAMVLRAIAHVFHLRVCAPMAFRERVMMERLGLGERSLARREIERNDAAHARTVQGSFGVDWQDPLLYDMVLNTERVATAVGAKLVCTLVDSPAFRATEESRQMLSDRLLEARIRIVLSDHYGAGTGVTGIEATVEKGKVILTGTAIHTRLGADAAEIVRSVPGVKEVENRVVIVRSPHASL